MPSASSGRDPRAGGAATASRARWHGGACLLGAGVRRRAAGGSFGALPLSLLLLLLAGCGGAEPPPAETAAPAAEPAPASPARAPEPIDRGELRPGGEPVTVELAGGETHRWDLQLDAGRLVRAVVLQQGIDVVAALEGPDGTLLVDADRPVGDHGPELVLAVTERAGRYVLAVSSPLSSSDPPPGRYRIEVEVRPAAAADRELAVAYRRFTEARKLSPEERPRRWTETAEVARRLAAAELEGEALGRLALHAYGQGDRRRTADLYRDAAGAFARAGAVWGEAIARVSGGSSRLNLGELEEAAAELAAGLEVARAAGDRHNEARALHGLGEVATRWGELQAALDRYESALALWTEDEPFFRAATQHGLGVLEARYLGDVEAGGAHLRAAAAAWPEDWAGKRAITLNQLGQLAFEAGSPAAARRHLEESLALLGEGGGCDAALTRARLALAEHAGGAPEAADRRLAEALGAAAGGACPVVEPTVYLLAAELARLRGDPRTALERYRRSLALFSERGDARGSVESLGEIAALERDSGAGEAALDAADRALVLVEGIRPTLLREDLRTSYFAGSQGLFDLRIDLLAGAGRAEEAWATAERARGQALRDLLIEAGAGVREDADPALAERERVLQRRLNGLEYGRLRVPGSDPARLREIEREIDAVTAEIETVRGELRRGLGAAAGAESLTASGLRELLPPDALLLEYRLGAERSHLWAVTREAVEHVELPPRAEVERLAARAAAWLVSPEWPSGGNPGPVCELSRALLGPVAGLLEPVAGRLGGRRLLLVPDGALETIAFAALPEPGAADCGSAPPLVAGREIGYLPSVAALGTLRRRLSGRAAAPGWLAVVADPVYAADDPRLSGRRSGERAGREGAGEGTAAVSAAAAGDRREPSRGAAEAAAARSFVRLRHAGAEADAILALAPAGTTVAATGFAAGRDAVLGGALGRYRVLHFATHGVLAADRPLLSFLALTQLDAAGRPLDGPLYAHEIYGLDLPAELVVLSACDTALGREVRGEGLVSGLPRAFLYAGAARVMVSLWEVRDDSTRELMTAFYRGLIERGLPPGQALREAQLAMWRAGHPPYRWAGFVLQGDPDPLPPFPR